MTTPISKLDELTDNQSSPHATVNEALRQLEGRTIRVLSRTTTAQPGSPADGDSYIIPASATGTDWSTYSEHDIAQYIGGAWQNVVPLEGWRVWVNDEDVMVSFDGTVFGQYGMPVIASDTTITVAASGGDYTTVQAALDSLDGKIISSAATATIEVQDEILTQTSAPVANHPQGDRIALKGASTTSTTCSNVTVSGTAGAYTCTITVASTTGASVGIGANITGCSGGTNPEDLNGGWMITAVGAGTVDVTCTSRYATGPSGAISGTVVFVPSVLKSSSSSVSGLLVASGKDFGGIQDIVFEGATHTGGGGHVGLSCSGQGANVVTGINFIINNFQRAASIIEGATCACPNAAISGNYYGVYMAVGAVCKANAAQLGGNDFGASLNSHSVIQIAGATPVLAGNSYGMIVSGNSTALTQNATFAGNVFGCRCVSHGYAVHVGHTLTRNTTDLSPAANTVGNEEAYNDT